MLKEFFIKKFQERKKKIDKFDKNDICSICLEKFSTKRSIQLQCGHIFHHHCAIKISNARYKEQRRCPLCRIEIDWKQIILP